MLRRAALRRDDHVAITVLGVDERRRPLLAGLPALGRQQEDGGVFLPDVPDLATGLAVAADVCFAVELRCVFCHSDSFRSVALVTPLNASRAIPLPRRTHATISAAAPTIRENRGTVASRSTCAQKRMSSSSPGGPYVRAFNPSSASGQRAAMTPAAIAASVGSPASASTIRPAQYASSSAKLPLKPEHTIATSPPSARAASASADKLSSEPTSTTSHLDAAVRIARVPFVVVKMSVAAFGPSANSRGDAPTSNPSTTTAFRSPPTTASSPSASRSARASSISAQHNTRSYPAASAWAIDDEARMTSTTTPTCAAASSSGVNATSTRTPIR